MKKIILMFVLFIGVCSSAVTGEEGIDWETVIFCKNAHYPKHSDKILNGMQMPVFGVLGNVVTWSEKAPEELTGTVGLFLVWENMDNPFICLLSREIVDRFESIEQCRDYFKSQFSGMPVLVHGIWKKTALGWFMLDAKVSSVFPAVLVAPMLDKYLPQE